MLQGHPAHDVLKETADARAVRHQPNRYFFMKKRYFLLAVLSGLGIEQVVAQQIIPPVRSEYIDSAGTVLPSAAEARFRREITLRWSGETGESWVVTSQPHGKSPAFETAAL